MPNPFKPSFGVTPPLLAGRDALIKEFSDALADGPGAAGRATLYTGARGAGKTVMLNAIQAEAQAEGWFPIDSAGRQVGDDALDVMVDGTQGYPFLIQLVGSHCWRIRRDADDISVADAETGVLSARRRLGSLVHAPALADASDVDKSYLLAMAKDDGRSKTADIARRLEVSTDYAGIYRRRLIDAELIEPAGYGHVDFVLPYLRDYLREHAASGV